MPEFHNVINLTEISEYFGYLLTTLVEYEFFSSFWNMCRVKKDQKDFKGMITNSLKCCVLTGPWPADQGWIFGQADNNCFVIRPSSYPSSKTC